ncbi:MAG: DUF1080 domain-containing protein [Gemmataceae bacterium]
MLTAPFIACVLLVASAPAAEPAPTKTVLLKLDVDLKDVSLEYVLNDREISAKTLQSPVELRHGKHELLVLRHGDVVDILPFEVGPKTGSEIVLKRTEPPPLADEPDFRPGLPGDVKPSPPATLSREELRRRGEWVPLFNGKDKSGWRSLPKVPGNWHVESGILAESGIFGGLFTVEDDWTDVHLRIEAKYAGGGTGVCLRGPLAAKPGKDSYDVFIGGKMGTGSLRIAGRDIAKVKEKAVPPDTWFTMDVILRGHHIHIRVNGKVVADHDDAEKTPVKGHIILQPMFAKGGSIQYKRVEVRDLAPPRVADKKPEIPAAKVPPRTADYGKYVVDVIPLSETLARRGRLMMARAPGGGFQFGWNDAKGRAHITPLGADLKAAGRDIILADTELRGLAVNDDGTIAALAFRAPCEVHLLGLSREGRTLFKTPLTGEHGNGPGTHFATRWFSNAKLISSGTECAVHFGHFVHTKGGAKHQGGYFARLDGKGNKLQENHWTVSHSIDQALLYHGGDWFTASVGDAHPVGIPFINRSAKKARSLIYPPKDQRAGFHPKLTHLGSMVPLGADVGLAFVTRVGGGWQAYYAAIDKTGDVKRFVNVLDTIPPTTHAGVNLAPFGSDLLLIWTETDTTTRYVPIDSAGRLLGRPTLVDQPIGRRNDLALFANGDVGWLTATRGASEVRLVRVKR